MIHHSYADRPCTAADVDRDVLAEGQAVHAPCMLRMQPGHRDQSLQYLTSKKNTLKRRYNKDKNENRSFIWILKISHLWMSL